MPVIGTAGHVDHGKSTLIQALTGRDPDRWDEEKRRGLTIDLGFAWTVLEDGSSVSFVDVPGHERFIKNMLAGTEGIDAALLVVAADEGWMPQSEEHLSVLHILGVDRGVVAITKVDRVGPEMLQLVELEVEEKLADSTLEGARIVPTSVPEGRGLDDLRAALTESVSQVPRSISNDRPKLWIDRAFTISGAGTVVTGTLTGARIRLGDRVVVLPPLRAGRVRGLQSHEEEREVVEPHSRVAVNLAGLEREEVNRGMLLAAPDQWSLTDRLLVLLETVRSLTEPLTNRGAYHLHLGSGAWPVRLRLVDRDQLTGRGPALIQLRKALPVAMGDRFILREVGRRAVVGGGRVLDPDPPHRSQSAAAAAPILEAALAGEPDVRATALLEVHGSRSVQALSTQSGGGRAEAGLTSADLALSHEHVTRLSSDAVNRIEAYHRSNPLRPGMPKASLASALGIDLAMLETLLPKVSGLLMADGYVASAHFESALSAGDEAVWSELAERLESEGLTVPRVKELGIDEELLHALVRDRRLVRVSDDLVYLPDQLAKLEAQLPRLPSPFTVAQFRDEFDISRKYAIPLLEWLDDRGVTRRDGDLRTLR